jgi:purine catabolism regulator
VSPERTAIEPLTVRTALRETALSEAHLTAGSGGLDRRIEGIAVLEAADLDAARPRQLLLVSAHALAETSLSGLMPALASRGVSALGVKLDPRWTEMPMELVAGADATGLPLLTLPSGRLEDLVKAVLSAIVEPQVRVLRTTAEFRRRTEMRDGAWASTATVLSEALGVEVVTFDEDGEVLAAAGGGEQWAAQLARAATSADLTGPVEVGEETFLVAPMSADGRRYGAVCIRGADAGDAVAQAVITEAAIVTSMQLLGHRHVEAVHRRFERELLDDLMGGRLRGREARERADRAGWPIRRPYMVLYVTSRASVSRDAGPEWHHQASDAALASMERALRGAGFSAHSFPHRAGLAIVVHFSRTEDPARVAGDLAARLPRTPGVPSTAGGLAVGVSRPADDVAQLREAVRQAYLAVTLSSALRRTDARTAHFDEIGAARLLALVPDRRWLAEVARAELTPLVPPDRDPDGGLIPTLGSLLDNNMRASTAAEELFFHYNTVRQRLGRLRELLGVRFDEPDGQLSLWLAVVALRLGELDDDRSTESEEPLGRHG